MAKPNGLKPLFAAIALVLIISVAAAYFMGVATLARSREVLRHRATIDQLGRTLSTLLAAESGQRGYLLTGDEKYLDPYHKATHQIEDDLHGLVRRGRGGELPEQDVSQIVRLVQEKLAELEHTIELRRGQGADASLEAVRSDT